jgi:hypothetical protein
MTESGPASKPPAPLVTRVVQLFGLAAVVAGLWAISTRSSCEAFGCLVWFFGLYVLAWGVVALLAGLRGPVGFVFLLGAIVLAMAGAWVKAFYGIIFLVMLLGLVRASKDRLAGYYRRSKPKVEAS